MSTPGPGPGVPGGGPADTPAPPTCFRHPDRETYVSCVRCGRPACPDCLRDAAVGRQCVECIRGGNQGSRLPSGVFGGRVSRGAVVTWSLVAINILLYLVEWARPSLADSWEMIGRAQFTFGGPIVGVATGQWYRLVTSAFLPPPGFSNLGPADIIFNMWALIIVGPALERTLGQARYLTVYLASAIGGSIMYFYLAAPNAPALGASGAIFGLLGAWFVVAKRLGLDSRWLVTIVLLNLVFDLALRDQIAWQAHVGGLLTGGLLTAAFAYAPRERRALLQGLATVALLALMAVAIIIRSRQLPY
ncbi:MAG TPA: rhomboid family intramembrane serine protease [Streptosporangiaceae bacterium]|nr:rhomboid family intramembrane serine protease [Streptosporangiaceae bacterium]